MDEFHFYAEPDRGWAWQVPLLELPQAQFLLMSATLGDVTRLRRRPDPAHRAADRRRRARRERPVPLIFSYAIDAAARDARGAAGDHAGAGLRRALHPGRRAGAGPGADERQRRAPGPRRTRSPRRSATSGSPPASARRCPGWSGTASACTTPGMLPEVPPAGRDARPGRAAQGHLRHRHPRRRHQRADPHRAVHRAVQVRRHPDPAAQGPRVPPDRRAGPGGPATTPSARSSCRRPSTSSRTRRRSPRPATTRRSAARWCARSRRRASSAGAEPTFDRLVAAEPEPLTVQLRRSPTRCCSTCIARARRRRSPRCGTCSPTTTRTPAAPAPAHPPGDRDLPGAAAPAGSSSGSPSPTRTGRRVRLDRRPPARLRAQPAAVAVRAGRPRAARPRVARRTRSTSCR